MKTTKYFLSMAALALVGAVMTGCSSSDDLTDNTQPQQSGTTGNTVTLTTTVNLGDNGTRALTSTGVKTFAVGETMALCYWNTSDNWVKAVSNALEAGDIADGSKSATFTFTLTDPKKSGPVVYMYPAAMAKEDGEVDNDALFNNQDGTLAKLASTFDYSFGNGAWDGDNLPSLTLENQLAILAITLKDEAGTSDITSGTTKLTVSDGTNTYNVNRSVAEGPIYVAIRPTTSANISIEAISGSQGYYKNLTTKTYEAGNGYPVSWRMTQGANLSLLTAAYTAQNGDKLTGTLGSNVKISIADGATVTLKNADINGSGTLSGDYAGITCEGNATITLEGTNTLKGFQKDYPGIYVPENKTLTIQGTGSLDATGGINAAGIGSGWEFGGAAHAGDITITGGTITATGGENGAGIGGGYWSTCGAITISGGTITATGGDSGAGIGSGYNRSGCGNITITGGTVDATGSVKSAGIGGGRMGSCGNINITSGVTKVTATKGSDDANSIGAGAGGSCGTITIEDGANVIQN